ncbi:MAG: helix-turn-helix domain-containing protein [Gemmiger sp.]
MYDMGQRLQQLRKAKGWSQETLGRKVNKAKSVISSYESNQRVPPLDVLTDFAALYGVSLDYLAGVDQREMLPVAGLSESQTNLMQTIVVELQSPHPAGAKALTPRQLDILNSLLYEFTKDR